VADKYPDGFGWYAMPVPQDGATLTAIANRLEPYEWTGTPPAGGGRFVQGSAADMAQAMYEGTKVAGVFEHTPKKIRGVFWMKGNAVGEELAALQYGDYHPEKQEYLFPLSPFAWGWPNGKPAEAPASGGLYAPASIEAGARTLLGFTGRDIFTTPISMAFGFDAPPDDESTKSNAQMSGFVGNPRVNMLNGWGYLYFGLRDQPCLRCCASSCCSPISQTFVLNEVEDKAAQAAGYTAVGPRAVEDTAVGGTGSVWRRGITWGCFGLDCIPFGGYDFVKARVSLYTILFHFKDLLWKSIILLLPPPAAKPTLLQHYRTTIAQYTPPSTEPPFSCHTACNLDDGNIV